MSDKNPDWPFNAWLRLAVIRFGLTPESFWAMSLSDWLTLIKAPDSHGLILTDLNELMTRYPDRTNTHD